MRNIGTNESPLFLPRQKPLSSDKLVSLPVNDIPLDWDNDGDTDYIVLKRHERGRYVDGVWAALYVKLKDAGGAFREQALTEANKKPVIFDNSTWSHMDSGDFNGDGFCDIVIGTTDSDLQILLNQSDGAAAAEIERIQIRFNKYASNPYDSGDMSLRPFVIDWNDDGRDDVVFNGWNGFCYLLLNKNLPGQARFAEPVQFMQLSGHVVTADSVTPDVVDWDDDGDNDLICGDVNGYFTFFENTGSNARPQLTYGGWLKNDLNEPIRITAAEYGGTIQGAVEKWWGYTSCQAADVDQDGDIDLIINDSLGRLRWIENIGTRKKPTLSHLIRPFLNKSRPLITPWRNRPGVADYEGDGVLEITVVNKNGQLERYSIDPSHPDYLTSMGTLKDPDGRPVSVFPATFGDQNKGRSQIDTADWDNDGDVDIMIGRPRGVLGGGNILFLENVGSAANPVFEQGVLLARGLRFVEWMGSDGHDQWHSGSPCMADWNNDGKMDLIFGTESGRIAFYSNDFFIGPQYPTLKLQTFEAIHKGKPMLIFDFLKDRSDQTEAIVPADSPLQWLDQGKDAALCEPIHRQMISRHFGD